LWPPRRAHRDQRPFGIRRRRRSDLCDRAAVGLVKMAGSARSEVDERPSMRAPRRNLALGTVISGSILANRV
jgi:hypothetical protein